VRYREKGMEWEGGREREGEKERKRKRKKERQRESAHTRERDLLPLLLLMKPALLLQELLLLLLHLLYQFVPLSTISSPTTCANNHTPNTSKNMHKPQTSTRHACVCVCRAPTYRTAQVTMRMRQCANAARVPPRM